MAEMSAWISAFLSILSMRARSTFRILPRMGKMACSARVAGVLGRAARRVPLHDEQLALARVARRAVDELAGQPRPAERRLAPGQVARGAGRHPGPGRRGRLLHDLVGLAGVLLQPVHELLVGGPLHQGPDRDVAELGLGLALELGVAQADRDDGRQALADVLALEVVFLLLERSLGPRRSG